MLKTNVAHRSWAVPLIAPEHVIFLSGAGISADSPTNGPIGLDLTRRALDFAFLGETRDELSEVYAQVLSGSESRDLPRLEAVLEIAFQVHGPTVLEALLKDLAGAAPNPLHRFFRDHLRRGGRHVTANFDVLIEESGNDVHPLHFHGSLGGDDGAFEHLGAQLSRLERGFDLATRNQLLEVLFGVKRPTIVVVGYSGLDFFDVDPFVASIAQELAASGAHVVWSVHHVWGAPERLATVEQDESIPPMVHILRNAGVPVTRVWGPATVLLNAFARQWQIPPLRPRKSGQQKVSLRPLALPERAEATRRLYLHMGMLRSHERLVRRYRFLDKQVDAGTKAEIEWQRGKYRRAQGYWDELYSAADLTACARRWERRAAVLWVRGSYLRAYAVSHKAVRLAVRSTDVEALGAALETQARILVHAARTPDLCWFSTSDRRQRLSEFIGAVTTDAQFGTHLKVRLGDARGLLLVDPERGDARGRVSKETPLGEEAFNQYESLSASLDFRRGSMRARVQAGLETMTREWLDAYCRAADALGKDAAIRSLPTLPGAPRLYSLTDGVYLLARSPATLWHRLRLIAWFLRARSVGEQTR